MHMQRVVFQQGLVATNKVVCGEKASDVNGANYHRKTLTFYYTKADPSFEGNDADAAHQVATSSDLTARRKKTLPRQIFFLGGASRIGVCVSPRTVTIILCTHHVSYSPSQMAATPAQPPWGHGLVQQVRRAFFGAGCSWSAGTMN